ncbi:VRR-NUC domain-containing protein [Xenorhabdus sp. 42]|uniref:VRR-NUC domain-containing protein n=1 Tax=Xenorhabdus szentirmaii TaxID=290112 RepID=UPI00199E138E|nr:MULTISPECIES: VRR-NUC domain-containing protein [unclassified Xenorhabdus]MBD2780849.1 VRR-NUC domain-containing protein [Xenorhabdus sp. 38]MBD2820721.1 VRR-NUC domain-containing protein [Xenorhabdus sp. 42]
MAEKPQQLKPGTMCPAVTSVNCRMEQIEFPKDEDQCYLARKAALAIWAPKISFKKGKSISLRQATLSQLIKVEENASDWQWQYKAEVSFYMRGRKKTPLPKLATSAGKKRLYAGNLPHSGSWFLNLSKQDIIKHGITGLRRPDIVLVKNKQFRWPGRDAQYLDGSVHPDNLKVLIEVKFPGDSLSKGQKRDYPLIAGKDRFGLFVVEDNRDSEEWKNQSAEAKAAEMDYIKKHMALFGGLFPPIDGSNRPPSPAPAPEVKPTPPPSSPLPIPTHTGMVRYMPKNLPLVSEKPWQHKPMFSIWMALSHDQTVPALITPPDESSLWEQVEAFYDQGVQLVKDGFTYTKDRVVRSWEWTWDLTASGINYLTDKTREALAACGAWFRESGKWIADEIIDPVTNKLSYAIHWVSEKTGEIVRLTEEKITEAVEMLYQNTDLTIEALKHVDWYQIAADLGNGTVELMVKIGEEIVTLIETIVVVAAIVLLVGLIIWVGSIVGGVASAVWAMLTAAAAGMVALTAATA